MLGINSSDVEVKLTSIIQPVLMALTTPPRGLIIKPPVAVDPASSPNTIATGMFRREGSFRRSLGGGDDNKRLFGRRSSTLSNLDSAATDGPSTPSRTPAPISPSSSTKKRTLGSIFRSKSKKETPSSEGRSITKASPSLPAIGRALPLPSPPSTGHDDYFAKTPTKSQKHRPRVTEQSELLSKTGSDESVPKQLPASRATEPPAPLDTTSCSLSAVTNPATATVNAKHFVSETVNHEQLRQLASRISTPPDSADSGSVKTFGTRSKASTPPELGEVWTSKPVVATQQINLEDAVPIHGGVPGQAEDVLMKVDGRGLEREESLKKALGTSPSTWDVNAQSSRSPSPPVGSHHPSLERSASNASLVQMSKTPQTEQQYLTQATYPTPSAIEAAAQASLEAAIHNTPLNPVALPPSSIEHVPVAPALAQTAGLEPAALTAIPTIKNRDEPPVLGNVEQPADLPQAVVEPESVVASSKNEPAGQLEKEPKSDLIEHKLDAVDDNADDKQTVDVASHPSPKLDFTRRLPRIDDQPLVKATLPTPSATEAAAQASLEAAIYNTPLNPVALPPSSTEHVAPAPALAQSTSVEPAALTAIPTIKNRDEPPVLGNVEQPADLPQAVVEPESVVASSENEATEQLEKEPKSDLIEHIALDAVDDNADDKQTVDVASHPSPKLDFTGQFATDQAASITGSRKIPLLTLPSSPSFTPAPYNTMLPGVLHPRLAVELDFAHGWGWVPAVRGGWVDKAHSESRDKNTNAEKYDATPPGVHPRPRITSWVSSVPVVGRLAGYAGW